MAVALASPHNCCAYCGRLFETPVDRHVCAACGKPQPVAGGDYFSAFEVPKRLKIDRADLESRFYKISRALHPDRFTTLGSESQRVSLERMSWINQAYRTLKDPDLLRDYVLELEGLKTPADQTGRPSQSQARIPMELAEGWFELQDTMVEEPGQALEKLAAFEKELRSLQEQGDREIASLDSQVDAAYQAQSSPRDLLQKLAHAIQSSSYLKSMERDVARIREKISK